MSRQMQIILMAAGLSRRYGENKLLVPIHGKPMFRHVFDHLVRYQREAGADCQVTVVTQTDEIIQASRDAGFEVVYNAEAATGIASTIRLGLLANRHWQPGQKLEKGQAAAVFFTADQPQLRYDSVLAFMNEARTCSSGLLSAAAGKRSGNPVSFDAVYFDELCQLGGDTGGKAVLNRHLEDVTWFAMAAQELDDIDEPQRQVLGCTDPVAPFADRADPPATEN